MMFDFDLEITVKQRPIRVLKCTFTGNHGEGNGARGRGDVFSNQWKEQKHVERM